MAKSKRVELIYRDDSGAVVRTWFRSVGAALAEGQALAAYGLLVFLRHSPNSRPVRCMA